MQWIFVVKPTHPEMLSEGLTPEETAAVSSHFQYWLSLNHAGNVLVVGRTQVNDHRAFGIAIFKTATEEEAANIASSDPAVVAGVFSKELFPYAAAIVGDPAEWTR